MSDIADRTEETKIDKDEKIIRELIDKIDLKQYITDDKIEVDIDLVPGFLTVRFRSQTGEDVCETDNEILENEISDKAVEFHYRVFRSLGSSIVSINGVDFMPGAGIPAKISGLKKKPKHILDKIFWGNSLFNEALRRVLSDADILESKSKN